MLPACALAAPPIPASSLFDVMFGKAPSYAFYLRHVKGIEIHHVKVGYVRPEGRTGVALDDVSDASDASEACRTARSRGLGMR